MVMVPLYAQSQIPVNSLSGISSLPAAPAIQGVVSNFAVQQFPESTEGTYTCIGADGCFSAFTAGNTHGVSQITNNSRERDAFRFNAASSSDVYGRANTIRPLSQSCKFFIRYI